MFGLFQRPEVPRRPLLQEAHLLPADVSGAAPFQIGGSLPLGPSRSLTLSFKLRTSSSTKDQTHPPTTAQPAETAAPSARDAAQRMGQQTQVTFPLAGPSPTDAYAAPGFQALLAAARPAVFGKGKDTVLDPGYRNALELSVADSNSEGLVDCSIRLPSPEVLRDVLRLLMPQAAAVSAGFYKLNIYGPGGFFKSHRDTPRAPNMFGSLVICLPTHFSGGQLVIRSPNNGTEITHNWGSSSSSSSSGAATPAAAGPVGPSPAGSAAAAEAMLKWAAFYSDCEHEILPVTQGYRVTLTYNLIANTRSTGFNAAAAIGAGAAAAAAAAGRGLAPVTVTAASSSSSSAMGPAVDVVTSTAFGQQLAAKLRDAGWCPEGATLGFVLEHHYAAASDADKMPVAITPAMLKGSDLLLHQAARQLGLTARLAPLIQLHSWNFDESAEEEPPALVVGKEFGTARRLGAEVEEDEEGPFMADGANVWWQEDQTEQEFLCERHDADDLKDIIWAKPPGQQHWKYSDTAGAFGNSGDDELWYAAAALLVQVPAAGSGCRAV